MKRYNTITHKTEEFPEIDNFLNDIFKVYEKHGLAISHEDSEGGFRIVKLDKYYKNWLNDAAVDFKE